MNFTLLVLQNRPADMPDFQSLLVAYKKQFYKKVKELLPAYLIYSSGRNSLT
jgi:hypothetical protein